MNKPRKVKSPLLEKLRQERDLVEHAQIRTAMVFSHKIANAMRSQGLSKSQTAELFGQKPSVISKWLSGRHNFTANTLCEIGKKLGINFFSPEEVEEYIYKGTIDNSVVQNIFILGDNQWEQNIKVSNATIEKIFPIHEDENSFETLVWSVSPN